MAVNVPGLEVGERLRQDALGEWCRATMNDIPCTLRILREDMADSDEVKLLFQEEIRRRPGGARAHYNLGTILLETGRAGEALDPLERAAALDPGDPDALVQLGLALSRLGRHAEALDPLERALALDGSLSGPLRTLAEEAEAAGDAGVAARARALAGNATGRTAPPGR